MRRNRRHAGFSLVELMVVVTITALAVAMVMPVLPQMLATNRQGATKDLVRGFLTLARAHAAQTQRYAGIRFQQSAAGRQYMVLIEYDDESHAVNDRFFAVAGTKPIALPEGIGTISMAHNRDDRLDDSADMDSLAGARTFSIVFSPTGQLVTKQVTIYERIYTDKTFGPYANTLLEPRQNGFCLLSYDSGWPSGPEAVWCGPEDSVGGLYICDMGDLTGVNENMRYSEYLYNLPPLLVNMYTGTLIE